MGIVNYFRNNVDPRYCTVKHSMYVLANTWPCPPAQYHSTAVHKACPYMVILLVQWWRVGSILNEDALAFSYLAMLFIQKAVRIRGYMEYILSLEPGSDLQCTLYSIIKNCYCSKDWLAVKQLYFACEHWTTKWIC